MGTGGEEAKGFIRLALEKAGLLPGRVLIKLLTGRRKPDDRIFTSLDIPSFTDLWQKDRADNPPPGRLCRRRRLSPPAPFN